ncbi:hypothetical protein [Umezawaea sp. Da 62-37]|uniref:hypothetical protein n=1 Tax=Umezawaea sp. Da 62-37 TaxID=3075927 RepID=UPI0028F73AF1|nr:hypothetical protein [Umezawaea sp. Da 62-37]WNV83108.1 hypothetical protein RM788_33635 [Umezawaea sp. Da 62-37]
MPVTCRNRKRHADDAPAVHDSVDAVRACFLAEQIWTCDWQVPARNDEDGEDYAVDCGGLAWFLPDDRGYTCEYGHEHIHAEVRRRERWDYAADPQEAGLLAGRGIQPVAMNGGGIDIDPQAMRYAASLPG